MGEIQPLRLGGDRLSELSASQSANASRLPPAVEQPPVFIPAAAPASGAHSSLVLRIQSAATSTRPSQPASVQSGPSDATDTSSSFPARAISPGAPESPSHVCAPCPTDQTISGSTRVMGYVACRFFPRLFGHCGTAGGRARVGAEPRLQRLLRAEEVRAVSRGQHRGRRDERAAAGGETRDPDGDDGRIINVLHAPDDRLGVVRRRAGAAAEQADHHERAASHPRSTLHVGQKKIGGLNENRPGGKTR